MAGPGTESTVTYTPGTGTSFETITLPNGAKEEVVAIGDGRNAIKATVFDAGYLRTTAEPQQLFYDPFDAALDVVNDWSAANSGGGVAQAVASGSLALGTGTTAGGYSWVRTISTFRPSVPAWLGCSQVVTLADGAAPIANSYRFWGMGTIPGTPTVAAPLTDAVGFEMTTAGHLVAVVYANGSRTAVLDLNGGTQPTDALPHRYGVYIRTDKAYWFIDTLDNVVATSQFQGPAVQTLPHCFLAVAGTTPASSAVISSQGTAVWDTGGNSIGISDGARPYRKATVKPASTQTAATDLPLVTAPHPSTPTPMLSEFQVEATITATTSTTQTVTFAALTAAQIAQIDGGSVDIFVDNNATGQNISAVALSSTDTIGSHTATIPHPNDGTTYNQFLSRTSGVIATNTVGVMTYHLSLGLLRNITVALTWASAPTAGGVITVRLVFHGATQPSVVLMDKSSNIPMTFKSDGSGSSDALPVLPVGGRTPGTGAAAIAHNLQTSDLGALAQHPGGSFTKGSASMNINTTRQVFTAANASSSASLVAAPAAGLSIYITELMVTNTGATAVLVSLTDGLTIALASALLDSYAPAGVNATPIVLKTPIKLTAATALGYLMSAASTSVYIRVGYYVAP